MHTLDWKGVDCMCTAFSYYKDGLYFGRNMDIEFNFGQKVIVVPRGFKFNWKEETARAIYSSFGSKSQIAIIGMANITDNYPFLAEGVNEYGLCMASLNYPGNAYYGKPEPGHVNLAPPEFIPYILSNFKSVDEAMFILKKIKLCDVLVNEKLPLAPLHYILSDREKSVVIEPDKNGTKIYENTYGVLTNNPSFPYHLANMENYMGLRVDNFDESFTKRIEPKAYGRGLGAIGLPGDSSPASRFVRATYYKYISEENDTPAVPEVFRILDIVSMVKGSVKTEDGKDEFTAYSACIDAENGIYYFKTYDSLGVFKVKMADCDLDSDKLFTFDLPAGGKY